MSGHICVPLPGEDSSTPRPPCPGCAEAIAMRDNNLTLMEWHADDCGGRPFCDGCGYIAGDGLWYPGPKPGAA